MSQVRNKDTIPEKTVRSIVHRMGFRFRLHNKTLPGKPDIVLSRHKKIILVHGCFWHQHSGCSASKRPTSRTKYWNEKLDDNVNRDKINYVRLRNLGWRVLVVWECQVKDTRNASHILEDFLYDR